MEDIQAAYARKRALVDLLLAEVRAALDRHEARADWARLEDLDRVEHGLADSLSALGEDAT